VTGLARVVCHAGPMASDGNARGRRWWPAVSGRGTAGDMAIDLGTANTVVYVRGEGIVLSEPSVVAIDERVGEVYAVGTEAQQMIGRTPASISATRPLRHGVIADFDVTEQMLRRFMAKVVRSRWARPRLVMCAPSGITEVERRAMEEASMSAGGSSSRWEGWSSTWAAARARWR
jgi:rod shape-determining protein MreB